MVRSEFQGAGDLPARACGQREQPGNPQGGYTGAFLICDLCQCVQLMEGMEDRIGELLQVFKEKSGRSFLHTICLY